MSGAVEGYLLGYACRKEPPFQRSLQHFVLESVKDKSVMPLSKQPVGFVADGVVYNLLCFLHTGGNEHLAVGVRLYLLLGKLFDVAFPQSGQAAEKERPFQNFLFTGSFGKPYQFLLTQMLPHGWDALYAV